MTIFRLATLNVHSFSNPKTYENNLEELVELLKPYNLDLIAVQEIENGKDWTKFCELLSLPHHIFGESDGYYIGNGIASRYPIKFHSNQQTICEYISGRRSLLKVCLDSEDLFLKDRIFGVTHLDQINENVRLEQIKEFNPYENNIDILMGDMNSLTYDDYTDDYYQKNILQLRKKSNWEKPCFQLTELIKNQWNYQDAFKQINPDAKDEQVVTSRFKTRIDYIYLHSRINHSCILKKCSIIDTKNITDHNAVLAVFQSKYSI
jgi:endonuclease/exonuclease/phosphatase family metal-dependent hydrolase